MKKVVLLSAAGMIGFTANAQIGKVGINTTTPQAMLHVKDSSVLFTGAATLPTTPGNPPVSGGGVRMMWYSDKGAFRVGKAQGLSWDKSLTGFFSFATGAGTIAWGDYSFAAGESTVAKGLSSIATGINSDASGSYSTAMGEGPYASGRSSGAFGAYTKAAGDYSISMGYQTNSKAYSCFSIGRYNDSISTSTKDDWILSDPVFIIGNGIGSHDRSNAFIITKNARTGINIANGLPGALLHLKAFESNFDMHIKLEDQNSADYAAIVYDGDMKFRNFGTNDSYLWRDANNTTRMHLASTGNLSIDGTLSQSSDSRLKQNINPLQKSLQKITLLSGYHYNWIDNARDKKLQTGLLAQEVEKQMPELVSADDGGLKSVNYSGLIPYLVEAIKELKEENNKMKAEIKQLAQNKK